MVDVEDPTVHQLRLLLTLTEELHFGRAAARLFLTQSALSQQIRSLERRLGVELLTRTSRRVEVTPVGHVLIPLAKDVVYASDRLRRAARRSALGSGQLRLGLSDCAAPLASTRQVLATVTALHPQLEVSTQVVDLADQSDVLREGQIDAAFVFLPVHDQMHIEPLTTEPRVVCVSTADPLAERSSIWLADLGDRPVVSLTSTSPAVRNFWAVDPRPDGRPVHYTDHRASRVEAVLSAVSFDGAIAFLPAVVRELYPRPDVAYLKVHDLPYCTFGLVWPASDHETPQILALDAACRYLREQGVPTGTGTARQIRRPA